jgi:hypothetical protein
VTGRELEGCDRKTSDESKIFLWTNFGVLCGKLVLRHGRIYLEGGGSCSLGLPSYTGLLTGGGTLLKTGRGADLINIGFQYVSPKAQ